MGKEIVIIWTIPAKEDLLTIHNFLAQISEVIADRLITKILNKVEILRSGFVERGQEEPLLLDRAENYKIIYRSIEKNMIIDAVFDTRQNPIKMAENI